jgi:predicted transcriptional regulator
MLDGGVRAGGPIPKFNDYHIWKALNYLDDKNPVGRKKLASVLGIGEGSTRTILNIMQDENLISIGKSGIFLTDEGMELKKKLHMDVVRLPAGDLTIGEWDCAVRVPRMARNVKFGCEERDRAIISGAKGATTLVYTNNKLMFAGSEYAVDAEMEEKIKAVMNLKNDDVVIIGTGPDIESAENGAVAAGLSIMGGLGFGRNEEKTMLSPNISGNELISLAFAIHDLVGGLPVCAKSKNNLGIRIENGTVIDNAYTGAVLEEVIEVGTTIRRIAVSGPYKGIRVIVTPIEFDSHVIAAIGVVDIRSMAGQDNLIRLSDNDDRLQDLRRCGRVQDAHAHNRHHRRHGDGEGEAAERLPQRPEALVGARGGGPEPVRRGGGRFLRIDCVQAFRGEAPPHRVPRSRGDNQGPRGGRRYRPEEGCHHQVRRLISPAR